MQVLDTVETLDKWYEAFLVPYLSDFLQGKGSDFRKFRCPCVFLSNLWRIVHKNETLFDRNDRDSFSDDFSIQCNILGSQSSPWEYIFLTKERFA